MDFEACRREFQSKPRAKAVEALSQSEACLAALGRTLRWENPIQPIRLSAAEIVRTRIRG